MQYDSDYEVRLATLGAMGGNTGVTYDSVYEIDLEILRLTEQGGGGGGTGTSIDDTVTSTTKTWSSSKINNELAGKQGALTAGDNITIVDGVISATGGGVDIDDSTTSLTETWSSSKISSELADKANKADYIIGMVMPPEGRVPVLDTTQFNSITTDGVYSIVVKTDLLTGTEEFVGFGEIAVISVPDWGVTLQSVKVTYNAEATKTLEITRMSEDGVNWREYNFASAVIDDVQDPYATMPWSTYSASKIRELLAAKQDTLTAGINITISNNVISAQQPDLSGYATSEDLNNGLSFKQNTLTAGTGIEIVNDVISSPSEIDDIHAGSATTYSSNKIIELTQGLGFDVEIVQALPQTGDAQTIYMLPKADSAATDVYEEYIYTNNAWEKIGSTYTDLTQYYTKSETDTLLGGKQATLTAGTGIQIVDNVISATGGGGTELSAGTNISIVANKINANGYNYNSSNRSMKIGSSATTTNSAQDSIVMGHGAYAESSRSVVIGMNASAGTYQHTGSVAIGPYSKVGLSYGVAIACRSGAVTSPNTMLFANNTKAYLYGVGNYSGQANTGSNPKDLATVINGKQDTLTAGTGIQIVDNVISATGGGGGQSLSAGTNISIQNDLINALGYEYDSTLNAVKMGQGLNASGNNSVVVGQYNRSRTTSSGDTIFAVGVGTGTENANRVNAIETLSNGKTYVNGVGGYTGQGLANTKSLDEAINEISTVANAAATIDDSASSATKAYSSQKVDQLLSGKQASLTAGDNITISNNTISAAGNVASTSVFTIWSGTQAQYDALSSHSNYVLYLIK